MPNPILFYVHDPMCSWCWGFTRILTQLLEKLPPDVEVRRVLGGLAPDTDLAMPEEMQQGIKNNWLRIEDSIPGVKFNFDFWTKTTPRRSTYPACRAVIAARQQGVENDIAMTKAIQKAYYQDAQNPSDNSTLIEIAETLKLSIVDFKDDLISENTERLLTEDLDLVDDLHVGSFPSLVLRAGEDKWQIRIDYNSSEKMLSEINKFIEDQQ